MPIGLSSFVYKVVDTKKYQEGLSVSNAIASKSHFLSKNVSFNLSHSWYRLRHLHHFYFCRVGSDYTEAGRDLIFCHSMPECQRRKNVESQKKKARITLSSGVVLGQHFLRRMLEKRIPYLVEIMAESLSGV